MRNNRTTFMLILALCFTLRLLFFMAEKPWNPQVQSHVLLYYDSLGYHNLATTLLHSGRFASNPKAEPDALRTPLYPLFVASSYALFGERPWVTLLIQIMLDTASCYILMVTVIYLFDSRIAVGASFLYALNPFLIVNCSTLLSDVLFVFLLICSFAIFAVAYKSTNRNKYFYFY